MIGMEVRIKRFEEGTDYDPDRGFYRFKKAVFTVDGAEHTLRISMKDFDEGRSKELVDKEAQKILDVLGRATKK